MTWKKLHPELEKLFDRFADSEELIRIERLEIDIGALPLQDLNDLFSARILTELETQLYRLVRQSHPEIKRMPLSRSRFEQWLYFLEHGSIPWPIGQVSEDMLQGAVLKALSSDTSAMRQLQILLPQSFPGLLFQLIFLVTDPQLRYSHLIKAIGQ